ncbi:bifunctional 2-polyprenyl-6-hydroxyphenol methylase/3-demethylubiquinol 3-O-methyltransferase UbiG [Thermopetrobacter sp. TC1]|uniref:bifunctional 2-polyprenyl-6-hydroxyphenol methylase/3-demethylubiquinol 3-O-methyltransferase UbiG n=1 Tax=Thermopetrobacter sp. TC1 TaxID=1495045 RepID=UPI0006919FDB|nr:bifunctional 2-polyprenyl-6-hydroxyphenol methylase/3-demethylubiquinol 3-O-methyltransferase UbiG [Thermopetrobacter sp. TC1]
MGAGEKAAGANEETQAASVDPAEIAKFSALAAEWWRPDGKFAVLHAFNPVRLQYIRDHVTAQFGLDPRERLPLKDVRILDIGCGGGLISENLAKMGADVTGIDPSAKNIGAARAHAEESGVAVDYRQTTAEALAEAGETFDVVLNMEVIEHVSDQPAFIRTCGQLVREGGLMFCATINRTFKSFAMAIVGAEYVLGWLPRGTHQWEKFVKPEELQDWLNAAGLEVIDRTGVAYNPFSGKWLKAPRDMDVNYMLLARKRPA